jgi:hypothetical protein
MKSVHNLVSSAASADPPALNVAIAKSIAANVATSKSIAASAVPPAWSVIASRVLEANDDQPSAGRVSPAAVAATETIPRGEN